MKACNSAGCRPYRDPYPRHAASGQSQRYRRALTASPFCGRLNDAYTYIQFVTIAKCYNLEATAQSEALCGRERQSSTSVADGVKSVGMLCGSIESPQCLWKLGKSFGSPWPADDGQRMDCVFTTRLWIHITLTWSSKDAKSLRKRQHHPAFHRADTTAGPTMLYYDTFVKKTANFMLIACLPFPMLAGGGQSKRCIRTSSKVC